MKKDKEVCRQVAAKYLGVSSPTLRRYNIPFRQYTRYGYALYKISDLDQFIEGSKKNLPQEHVA